MFKLMYISWFYIFVESLSVDRSSLEESHYDQIRFARADFPSLDYYSRQINDDYISPNLKVNRFEPREQEYHRYPTHPRIKIYQNAPMEMYPTAPLTQIEPRETFEDTEDKLAILNEQPFPVISYFVPNNRNPNALVERTKQESSEHQMTRSYVNKKVNRSKQEMKYEQEIKRDRMNKGKPGSGELDSETTQSNSSELDNPTTPNNFQ